MICDEFKYYDKDYPSKLNFSTVLKCDDKETSNRETKNLTDKERLSTLVGPVQRTEAQIDC